MLTITIKQGKEKSLLAGERLIYVSAIDRVDGKPGERLQSGATALVQTSSGQFLARAAFSPQSQIRARVWSFEAGEPIDHAFIKRRVKAAVAKRRDAPHAAGTPLQLVIGDEDGLPGLHVDWIVGKNDAAGFLVCRFLAAGVDAWKIPIVQTLMAETGCPNVYEQSEPLMRKAEALPDVSGALAGDEPPPALLAALQSNGQDRTENPAGAQRKKTAQRAAVKPASGSVKTGKPSRTFRLPRS